MAQGVNKVNQIDLGKWAVIDIETTGVDPNYDEIIDVGYLQFDGTKLVRTYESLVFSERPMSQFIQKLTGIQASQIKKAPAWREVSQNVQELYGHHLLAHNADFEASFLDSTFRPLDAHRESFENSEQYVDTLYLLGLLAPWFSSLRLENFITEWKIAESEQHRGLADSVDLLKVMLVGAWYLKQDRLRSITLMTLLEQNKLANSWMGKFLQMDFEQLEEIASGLKEYDGWDLEEACKRARESFLIYEEQTFSLRQSESSHTSVKEGESENRFQHHFSHEFSGENIKSIFRHTEAMQERFSGYQYRESQEVLSLRVGQALKNGVHALVQAPTGTGKTLGYLLPASLYALNEGEQVLVATGTKTLQEQAMSKDVPQLYRLLELSPKDFPIVSLVGSQNHLCEMLFRSSEDNSDEIFTVSSDESSSGNIDLFSGGEILAQDDPAFGEAFTHVFFEWIFFLNTQSPRRPFLRADLPYIYKQKLEAFDKREREVAVDFRSCTGHKCPFKGDCTYLQGLRKAKEAKVIVGNHSLMFQWPRSFPRPSSIIIDEAHKIEQEATRAYGYEVSSDDLKQLQKNLNTRQGIGSLFYLLAQTEESQGASSGVIRSIQDKVDLSASMLRDHLAPTLELVESYFKRRPRYTDLYWNEAPMMSAKHRGLDQVSQAILNHLESIKNIVFDLLESTISYLSRWEVKDFEDDKMVTAYGRFETFVSSLQDIYSALDKALLSPDDHACSMAFHERYGVNIQCSPVDVGKVLHDGLLENSHSVLFTSATLGNANGDKGVRGIEWATGYTYLKNEKRFKSGFFLPAVYDYKDKTRVFLCDDTPSLHDSEFVPGVLGKINDLIHRLGGKSLLLFSARSRFEVAREILLERFEGEIPLFIQGMGSKVIEDFKQSQNGILLGMESFGEGIDIPGEALQFVFIDKIPDLRMDYVIQKRRDFYDRELGNEFEDYYLAHRSRSLHQKLGRLLRTETDRGGVIIVDSRVKRWKGRTLEKFFHLMRPYELERANLVQACDQVEKFILESEDKAEVEVNVVENESSTPAH